MGLWKPSLRNSFALPAKVTIPTATDTRTAGNASSAVPARKHGARTQAHLSSRRNAKPKSSPLTTSGCPCAASPACSACPATPSVRGLKKVQRLPVLAQTLLKVKKHDVLELDELWSFVKRRKDKRWVWLAQCRRTRQIVAYAIGDRSEATCALLWARVPERYKRCLLYTDFWAAYTQVLPKKQHRAGGKGAGETCHIERFNNILRQRLARFVRRTLSFSKTDQMHESCLLLFLHEYNTRIQGSPCNLT